MIVTRLELVDFRNYREARFDFGPGITAVVGLNGQGKTNLAEALAYLSTLGSFRGAPDEALIRVGSPAAVVRATVRDEDGREQLIELELNRSGRNRVQVNKQRLQRSRDLLGVMRVTVFAPDDLALVKDGPQERRRYMDDVLVSLAIKYDALRLELDRIVKQRNVLLKQAAGKLSDEVAITLDVWDAKFATCATSPSGDKSECPPHWRLHAPTMFAAPARRWARNATTSNCGSTVFPRERMRRRESNEHLPWRCASRPTASLPIGSQAFLCWCSTMCSANWTRSAVRHCCATSLRVRWCSRQLVRCPLRRAPM
jgi:RecF protein